MTFEPIDYRAVLQDLESKKIAINAAILSVRNLFETVVQSTPRLRSDWRTRGPQDKGRTEEMKRLRGEGLRLHEIGEIFGITRERVRQILKADEQIHERATEVEEDEP